MEQKPWLKIVGGVILVTLIFGGAYWLGSKQSPKNTKDISPSPSAETKTDTATTQKEQNDQTVQKEDSSASIEDITKNITTDVSSDQNALSEEASAEISDLEEGSETINDLGQSYDEDTY